jgi:hypothetical protein
MKNKELTNGFDDIDKVNNIVDSKLLFNNNHNHIHYWDNKNKIKPSWKKMNKGIRNEKSRKKSRTMPRKKDNFEQ